MATACDDPDLGEGPPEDEDEPDWRDSDADSVLSDDSVFPVYERAGAQVHEGTAQTLYEACAWNDPRALRGILERGVSQEEAMELDVNGRNGLMVAVMSGFVDIVYRLHTCPHIDVNHQDFDGNTALMIAAQAGFATILNYILNYFPGVDTEVRDPRGFTALLKAGLQGREDCMSALLMHGADMNAIDLVRGRGLKEWIMKTVRFEALCRLRQLQAHPSAQQFCESYVPEWPDLKHLVAKATATKTVSQKLVKRIKDSLSFNFPRDPQDNGAVDHMVRITTSIHSPLVATGCRPLCPTSPPEIGKRRLAVPELLAKHGSRDLEDSSVCHSDGSVTTATPAPPPASASFVSLTSCCRSAEQGVAAGVRRFVPRSLTPSNSVFPSGCIPKIEVTRSTEPSPKKEKKKKKMQKGYLEPPVWKYKEAKMEKKKEKKREEQDKKDKKDKMSKRKSSKK